MNTLSRAIMLLRPLILFACFITTVSATPVFIGTIATKRTPSEGIFVADFDSQTGKLSKPQVASDFHSPAALTIHPSKAIIYAVGKERDAKPSENNTLAAFKIETDHSLTQLAKVSIPGSRALNIAIDATGQTLAVPTMSNGAINTFLLDAQGLPSESISFVKHKSSGPHRRQTKPHAHGVYFNKANTHLYVPYLGADRVFIYPFTPATAALSEPIEPMKSNPGDGTRQLAFSPDAAHAYVINELSNTITSAKKSGNTLIPIDRISTLPKHFGEKNTTSEIEIHPNGKSVYAANRGHDSIAVFKRNENSGILALIDHTSVGGDFPCYLKIDPTGKWILCANLKSGNITSFPIDPDTGKLGKQTSDQKSQTHSGYSSQDNGYFLSSSVVKY